MKVIDIKEAKIQRARENGAVERSVDTNWDEYVEVGEATLTGQRMVMIDNSQHSGFALTPDEADQLALRLVRLAAEAREPL